MAKLKYPVILEKGKRNYGVYSNDIRGCISTGRTPEETLHNRSVTGAMNWAPT